MTNNKSIKEMIEQQNEACDKQPAWYCPNNYIHMEICDDGQLRSYTCWKKRFMDCYLIRQYHNNKLEITFSKVDRPESPEEEKLWHYLGRAIDEGRVCGCYIYGEPGIGKTYRAIAYCNDMLRFSPSWAPYRHTVAYVYVPQLINKLKANFDGNAKENERIIQKCIDADILVLDDLGAESATKWFYLNYLLLILNGRCEQNKKAIVISNLDFKQLQQTLKKNMNLDSNDCIILKRLISRLLQLVENKGFTYKHKDRRLG